MPPVLLLHVELFAVKLCFYEQIQNKELLECFIFQVRQCICRKISAFRLSRYFDIVRLLTVENISKIYWTLDGQKFRETETTDITETEIFRSCGHIRDDFMHFFHSADDSFLPWTGVMTGMFVASIYYWCTDQVRKS